MDQELALEPAALAQALIRCPSVTPVDAGALDILQQALLRLGFRCHRLPFSANGTADVDNLYARFGTGAPNFCFAGHTDVVPAGEVADWSVDPFDAVTEDGFLYGRGAADMKEAIACFVTAAAQFLQRRAESFDGSISLLITGDEEGPAINGTAKVLAWMRQQGEVIDHCLVGEPTNPEALGEMIKHGRRGSLNGRLTVPGVQGHVAYPHLAENPIPRLLAMLSRLTARSLDRGNAHFPASNLEVTTIDVGNPTSNLIPAAARASFNIRFNTEHSGETLSGWLSEQCEAVGGEFDLDIAISGEPFLTEPGRFTELIRQTIEEVTGRAAVLSTTGGTSDARFIAAHCPVAEFGLVGRTMHKTDECVALADLAALAEIYERLLDRYFA